MDNESEQSPLKILLVDANENDMLAFCSVFKNAEVQCIVTHCTSADDALEQLRSNQSMFDLVVSDFELPDKSGLDMFKEMKATGKRLPFMLLTQPGMEESYNKAIKEGVDDFILKNSAKGSFLFQPTKITELVKKFYDRIPEKRITEKLDSHDINFRTVVESLSDCIFVMDKNYNTLFMNNNMQKLIGKKSSDVTNQPKFRQFLKLGITEVFNNGKAIQIEDSVEIKNKTIHSISIITPIKNENGAIDAVSIIYRDVSKQKRVEDYLRKNKGNLEDLLEHRTAELKNTYENYREEMGNRTLTNIELEKSLSVLEATLEATADGILVMDSDQKIVSYNQRFAQICDIPDDIVRSENPDQVFEFFLKQLLDPEDFSVISEEISGQPDAETFEIIETIQNRVFECYSHPQWIGEEIVGRVWSFRDVTDRKRAEEALRKNEKHFRSIFDNTMVAFLIIDFNGNIVEANIQAARLFGYSSDELINLTFKKLIHPDYHILYNRFKLNSDGDEQFHGELIGICCNSSNINLKYKGTIFDYLGNNHILVTLEDNNEQIRLEKKLTSVLIHLEKEAKRQVETLAQFEKLETDGKLNNAREIDVKHIFVSLMANSEQIKENILELNKIVDIITDKSDIFEHLGKLINTNLIAMERITKFIHKLNLFSKSGVDDMTLININSAMKDTLKGLHNRIKPGVMIIEDYGKLMNMSGNVVQLNEIFVNLILNALEAVDKGKIRIKTHSQDDNIVIEIRDNGVGIHKDKIDQIFDPFFTTKKHNVGLGLSITRDIIQKHGGNISVKSKVGKGTKFTIRLPIEVVE